MTSKKRIEELRKSLSAFEKGLEVLKKELERKKPRVEGLRTGDREVIYTGYIHGLDLSKSGPDILIWVGTKEEIKHREKVGLREFLDNLLNNLNESKN